MSSRSLQRLSSALLLVLLGSCGGGFFQSDSENNGPAPAAFLTSPGDLSTITATPVSAAASAVGNNAIASMDFQVDAGNTVTVTAAPFSTLIDATRFATGQHVVRTRATDSAGKVSNWSGARVAFAPSASASAVAPAGFTPPTAFNLAGATFTAPTAFVQAPDGRFFVTQKTGQLYVVPAGGGTPVLVTTVSPIDTNGERGLLGIALHPTFAQNALVYLYYTTTQGGVHNRVTRLAISPTNVASAEDRVVDLPALSNSINNGGGLHFGADGKLYVGVGDDNISANAPSSTAIFGSLLRLNDDLTTPSDGPLISQGTDLRGTVWAYGLRNPRTFAFEPGTGRLLINDNGKSAWEEINLGAPKANYGWPTSEGPTVPTGATPPAFAYSHVPNDPTGQKVGGFFVGSKISGGAFYPSSGPYPAEYRGNYFFGDQTASTDGLANYFIGRYDAASGTAYTFVNVDKAPVDLLVGIDGFLYVLTDTNIQVVTRP